MQFQLSKCALKVCKPLYMSLSFFRYLSSDVDISVLSNGSFHSSKSLLIVAKGQRYLFNCGEGTQKIFIENGQRISLLKNIFFTRSSQQNLGGLIGMALGINCNNVIDLCLHGASKALDIIKASKKFIEEDNCKITFNAESHFEDSVFKVDLFHFKNKQIEGGDECVGYVFTSKQSNSLVDFSKCEDLGLPRLLLTSKLIAQFLHNAEITLRDGRIIKSKDVLKDPGPSNTFLVIECPTIGHIDPMSDALPPQSLNNTILTFVFHLTDQNVFQHESYQQFIQSINSKCSGNTAPQHIVIDSTLHFPLSYSTFYVQTCLNYFFDSEIFPKLKLYENYMAKSSVNKIYVETDNIRYAEPFMNFTINKTNINIDNSRTKMWSKLKYLNEEDIVNEILNKNAFFPPEYIKEKMDYLKKELTVKKETLKDCDTCTYPRLTFIGTSSSTPSKYRNITSILIEAKPLDFVMFDCGEGTVDRIIMLHGLEGANEIVRNLTMLCISHQHLDHHSGLYTLLRYRESLGDCKPCLLLTARNVYALTMKLDKLFDSKHCSYNCEWCFLDLLPLEHNRDACNYSSTSLDEYERQHSLKIKPVRVFHTSTSYGFVLYGIETPKGKCWKITYSGDCYPKFDGLLREGLDSDILIHEATMDDGLEIMAAKKRHCTVSQAIQEGVKMRSKFTVLTHFSSRYPLVPPLEQRYQNVAQAFDFMTINLNSGNYLKVLDSYLKYLFPKHYNKLLSSRQKIMRTKDAMCN